MIGYIMPDGVVHPGLLQEEVFPIFPLLEVSELFNVAPRGKLSEDRVQWFVDHCPNQYVKECLYQVIVRTHRMALIQKASLFYINVLEEAKLIVGYNKWLLHPEVNEALRDEKAALLLQATEFWGLDIREGLIRDVRMPRASEG